jgi:hypothetical protein
MSRGIVVSIHIAAMASAPIQSVAEVVALADRGSIFVYAESYGLLAFCHSIFCVD